MFESISWQTYLIATGFLVGGYYLIVTLLFYGEEITQFFRHKRSLSINERLGDDQIESNQVKHDEVNLMGTTRVETIAKEDVPREEIIESEELNFMFDKEDVEEPVDMLDEAEEEALRALVMEINMLVEDASSGSKEELSHLLQALLARYTQVSLRHRENINHLIRNACAESCNISFELLEINSWWS